MRPLLLLHGFTGSPRSWDPVLAQMPREVRALCPALFGHCADAAAVDSFEEEVDRIAELARAEGLRGGHLGGYSLGGRVALGLLVRHPDIFASATLVGAHPGLSGAREREQRRASDERRATELEQAGIEAFVDSWERRPLFASQSRLAPEILAVERSNRLAHDPRGLARALRVLGLAGMPDFSSQVSGVVVPVELVAGALDDKFARIAEEIAPRFPDATVWIEPGAGHNVVLEQPRMLAARLTSAITGRGLRRAAS